jgi:hypothetical protein
LTSAGHSDWKLPSICEFQGLIDYSSPSGWALSQNNKDVLNFATGTYWTNDAVAHDSSSAWIWYPQYGFINYASKTATPRHVRCVRSL